MAQLEDMVPEADWSDAKVLRGSQLRSILQAGTVQRLPDQIDAFCIGRARDSQALAELGAAIGLQSELLRRIPRNDRLAFAGTEEVPVAQSILQDARKDLQDDGPIPGDIKIPPPAFWDIAMPATQQPLEAGALAPARVAPFPQQRCWTGPQSFHYALSDGTALP